MSMAYIKARIIGYLYEHGGEASVEDLMQKFSDQRELILPITLGMLRDGLLEGTGKTSTGDVLKMRVKVKKIDFSKLLSTLTSTHMKKTSEEVIDTLSKHRRIQLDVDTTAKLVVTLPDTLMVKVVEKRINITSTVECFSGLLKKAKKEILLSVPFFEEEAISYFHSELKEIAKNGVRLKILIRGFHEPSNEYELERVVKGLRRLYDLYKSWGEPSKLEIRDFHQVVRVGSKSRPKHYESVHSKLLLVDGNWGYIGSAEMRENALFYNFETGLEIKGDVVKVLAGIFDIVWKNGDPIPFEILQSAHVPNART